MEEIWIIGTPSPQSLPLHFLRSLYFFGDARFVKYQNVKKRLELKTKTLPKQVSYDFDKVFFVPFIPCLFLLFYVLLKNTNLFWSKIFVLFSKRKLIQNKNKAKKEKFNKMKIFQKIVTILIFLFSTVQCEGKTNKLFNVSSFQLKYWDGVRRSKIWTSKIHKY